MKIREGPLRDLLLAWVHLGVLWAFTFAQPLFDVLADSAEFFVARGNTRGDIVLFAICMVAVPPTLLVLIEALFVRLPRVRRALHAALVAGLAAFFALQVLGDLIGPTALLLVLAAGLGVAAGVAYSRVRVASMLLSVLAPAPLVILILFLLLSPVSELVLPEGGGEVASGQVRSDTPVVFIVFDEFDPNMLMNARQEIDATRYPHLAELAERGTWYPNATTIHGQTTAAVPALLTGKQPERGALPIVADHPESLFTLLGDRYSLNVVETATEVCPEDLCGERDRTPTGPRLRALAKDLAVVSAHLTLPDGLDDELPAIDRTFGDFGGGARDEQAGAAPQIPESALRNRVQAFEDLLQGISGRERRPGLHFLHAALPHLPWQYLPSGQQYTVQGPDHPGLSGERWSADPVPALVGLQRHLLQVGYVDHLVGRLVRRLESSGLFDRAMVVLSADHGVSFRAGQPRRFPTLTTAADIAAVPLLIKYPGQREARVDDSMVRTIDIVPTIASELGTELPWDTEGRPIQDGGPEDGEVKVEWESPDSSISLSFAAFTEQREEGLRRMIGLFGSQDGGRGLYSTGPDAELLGRPAGALVAEGRAGSVELDSVDLFGRLDPRAAVLPSFITGRVEAGVAAHTRLAVAVNGTVRGVTQSFQDGDDVRLSAMVGPDSFRPGTNRIELYRVQGEASARSLVRVDVQRQDDYRLVEREGETLIAAGRRELRVEDGHLAGFVDLAESDDDSARLSGWAVDLQGKRPATRILVFAGGRLLAQQAPNVPRPDIVENYETSAVSESGFELRAAAPGVDLDEIRVFALGRDGASELPRYGG